MNAQTKIETGADIVLAVEATPQIVLLEPEKFDQFYSRVRAETTGIVVDLSTKKGRDEVRSLAAKVTRSKTMIDKAGLALTKQWRDQTTQVNAARKEIEAKLDALADEVRRPLTEWEDAEKARVDICRTIIDGLKAAAVVTIEDTAATVRQRGKDVWETEIGEQFGDMTAEAQSAKDTAVETLKAALARLTREEAERAELEKLRAEKAEADQRAAEEQAIRDAAEAKRNRARQIIDYIGEVGLGMIGGKAYPYVILIRELEEKIVVSEEEFGDMAGDVEKARRDTLDRVLSAQAEQTERSRKEAADKAAEEARQEEARKAEAAATEKQRKHDEAIADERRRAEEAEAAMQAERERAAKVEAERVAEEKRIAAEQKAREEDRAHRGAILKAAKEAIMEAASIDEATAKTIVLAIASGSVPHVTLRF